MAKKQTETRTIDGIEYKVFLRRVPERNNNVRNRREIKSNGTHENTDRSKKAKGKESISTKDGATSTGKKKVKK